MIILHVSIVQSFPLLVSATVCVVRDTILCLFDETPMSISRPFLASRDMEFRIHDTRHPINTDEERDCFVPIDFVVRKLSVLVMIAEIFLLLTFSLSLSLPHKTF